MERINNDKFNNMKKDIKNFSCFTEIDIIKETASAMLAEVDFYNSKCHRIMTLKKWIPKSILYFHEYENGIKAYLINREFVRYA